MNWIQINDNFLRVAYRWYGASEVSGKPVLVLLHGMTLDGHMWQPQLDALGQRFRLLVPDLRGHGHTYEEAPCPRPTVRTLADDLRSLLVALNVRRPVLVGVSLGGMTGLTYAARFKQGEYSPLAVIAAGAAASTTLTCIDKWQTYTVGWTLAPTVQLLGTARVTDLMFATAKLMRGSQWIGADAEVDDYVRSTMRRMTTEDLARVYALVLRYRGEDWGRITAPTLILVGEHESKSVHQHGHYLAKRTDGTFRCIPNAGHVVNMEQPARFNRAIEEFLCQVNI